MQIEYVPRIGFAARRAAQQQRHLPVGDSLFRQIVVYDDRVHAVVAEELADRAAGEGRQELHRRRVRSGGGDNHGVFERAVLFQDLGELGDRRALLADSDVDAVELLALVVPLVQRLLVEDRVERDRGLAGLTIADDEAPRWPRPIGIMASIALRPVAIGSLTDLRGMMPAALPMSQPRGRGEWR